MTVIESVNHSGGACTWDSFFQTVLVRMGVAVKVCVCPLEWTRFDLQQRHARIQRDEPLHVYTCDYPQSSFYLRLSDRGLEGDMGEERSHLLVPDFPLSAAGR